MPCSLRPILITGANGGLGIEMARHFLQQPDFLLFLACRTASKGQWLLNELSHPALAVAIELDVESDESIEHAVEAIKTELTQRQLPLALAAILNNAGVCPDLQGGFELSSTKYQPIHARAHLLKGLSVNTLGAAAVAEATLPLLRVWKESFGEPGVLINVSTSIGSLGFLSSLPRANVVRFPSYSLSKVALNHLTVFYAKREEGFVRVVSVAPGKNKTRLNNFENGGGDPSKGALVLVKEALDSSGETGVFIDKNGKVPW